MSDQTQLSEAELNARLAFLQREYDALQSQLKVVNWIAPLLFTASLFGAFYSWWMIPFGAFVASSVWIATHYIARTHVRETEERVADPRAHLAQRH